MPDSQDPKQVNNDLPNSQFGGGLINAESVNVGRIGGDIYNIHLGQQTVASENPAQSQNQRQRSLSEKDSLEKAYTLQRQKVAHIRNAWVIETDPSRKFQYKQQLQAESRTLKEIGDKLDEIEQKFQAAENPELVTDASIYPKQSLSQEEEDQPCNQSQVGIDYTRLRELLAARNWKQADEQTYQLMDTVLGSNWNPQILLNFPCTDLNTIDYLWRRYSNQRFGFSVQKNIYLRFGGQLDGQYNQDAFNKFGSQVEWRRKGWFSNQEWIFVSEVKYKTNALVGHLPALVGGVWGGGWRLSLYIFSRIETCKI